MTEVWPVIIYGACPSALIIVYAPSIRSYQTFIKLNIRRVFKNLFRGSKTGVLCELTARSTSPDTLPQWLLPLLLISKPTIFLLTFLFLRHHFHGFAPALRS
uniref:Uncharacterized protein n=1 Tax=Opuntia streptacantha TaxID=393608 RepID=A0A7C9DSG6_OPUST